MTLLAVVTTPASPSPWLYVLAAMLGGGVLNFLFTVYRRWRSGATEDAMSIAKSAQDQAANSSQLWERYKVELEDAKQQLKEYLEQLVSVNRELGKAVARISRLEEDLHHAHGESTALREQLVEARARRDELLETVRELQERIQALEAS